MRITGTLHSIGTHEIDGEEFNGILIATDDETKRAASVLLFATVDIYPHPVDGLASSTCTPENYAHALARLAHAEDHLAREVRSSQALVDGTRVLERALKRAQDDLQHAERLNDNIPGLNEARDLVAERDRTIVSMQGHAGRRDAV